MIIVIGKEVIVNTDKMDRIERLTSTSIRVSFGGDRANGNTIKFNTQQDCDTEWERILKIIEKPLDR